MAKPSQTSGKMESTFTPEVIHRPALGRHVQLGMLYDCMTDTILTDQTLWSTSKIENDKTVKSYKFSDFDTLQMCSTEEKAKVMHIKPDTLLSCYSDLIQPRGAAQYLIKQTPPGQKQIAIHYQCTKRLEQVHSMFFKKNRNPPVLSTPAGKDDDSPGKKEEQDVGDGTARNDATDQDGSIEEEEEKKILQDADNCGSDVPSTVGEIKSSTTACEDDLSSHSADAAMNIPPDDVQPKCVTPEDVLLKDTDDSTRTDDASSNHDDAIPHESGNTLSETCEDDVDDKTRTDDKSGNHHDQAISHESRDSSKKTCEDDVNASHSPINNNYNVLHATNDVNMVPKGEHGSRIHAATHVVSGIVYGGSAFFVFEHSKKKQGALNRAVKLLDKNVLDNNLVDNCAAVVRFESALQNAGMRKCEMYSDFHPLQEQPLLCSNFTHTCKELLRQLSCGNMNTVPVTLWLTPLTMFDENAKKVKCEVSPHVVSKVETLLLKHHARDRALLEILMSQSSLYFDSISTDTNLLREENQQFLWLLKQKLSMILPQIRCGDMEEINLPMMLERYLTDSDQTVMLNQYEEHVKSVGILDGMIKNIASIDLIGHQDLSQKLTDCGDKTLICLMIHSEVHSIQDKNLNNPGTDSAAAIIPTQGIPSGSDFVGLAAKLKTSITNFYDIVTANKDKSELGYFLVQCGRMEEDFEDLYGAAGKDESVSINVYINGELAQRNYVPPSNPGEPSLVESTHESITVSWDPSISLGNEIQLYEIHCRRIGSPLNQTQILHSDGPVFNHTITGLLMATSYEVKVRAICKFQMSGFSVTSRPMKTRPFPPPQKPDVRQVSPLSVKVSWRKPQLAGGSYPSGFTIIVRDVDSGLSTRHTFRSSEQESEIQVEPRKTYRFSLRVNFFSGNNSMPSEESEPITVEATDEQCMKYHILQRSDKVRSSAALPTHQIALDRVSGTAMSMNHKFEFGKPVTGPTEKVIMVVGATGAGKTTLINSMINYILRVDFRDKYRFRLVREDLGTANQAVSQTQHIIAYTLHHQKGFQVPYTLTIIDTPGFGDTSGINRDKQITKELHGFFSSTGPDGIDHIDAIGFVVQASLPRLTATQRYIFDSILSIFGKDIEENIFLLVTFADGKKPPVLAGIKQAKMAYKKFYKFNNSAIFSDCLPDEDEDEEDDGFDEMFWKMGMKSFKTFFNDLQQVESKSLQLTKDVLDERNRLELNVTQIQIDIKLGLNKLGQLDIEVQVLMDHRSEIDRNKNFTYDVTEDTVVKQDIPCGQHTTTCLTCNRTCHENCIYSDDAEKARCWAMTNNYCRICPNKCIWSMHKNLPYVLKVDSQTVTKTADDLKARYEAAQGKCLNAEQLIAAVCEEFENIQLKVLFLTEEVRQSIERLQHIALKPHPLSALEYIDVLIDAEHHEGHAGWRQRVQQLHDVRKTAEHMQNIARPDYDPFEEYRNKVKEEQKNRRSAGAWDTAFKYFKRFHAWSKNKLNF